MVESRFRHHGTWFWSFCDINIWVLWSSQQNGGSPFLFHLSPSDNFDAADWNSNVAQMEEAGAVAVLFLLKFRRNSDRFPPRCEANDVRAVIDVDCCVLHHVFGDPCHQEQDQEKGEPMECVIATR